MSASADPRFEQAIRLILDAVKESGGGAPTLSPEEMTQRLDELAAMRGRPAFYPYLGSGIGRGARSRMANGRWVLDFALGIGVHLFGHGDPDLISTALRAAASDLVMQGNLIFNLEYHSLMKTLLGHAPKGMANCWLSLTGADANENALKLLRQKRNARPGVIAFRGCFHGRTVAMAEITDRPDYRQGQPSTFPVFYVPFYDRYDPASADNSLAALRSILSKDADRICAFIVELVQGEAGFITAPREFFVPLFNECRKAGVPVWADEVQTFGRVTDLFATNWLDLSEYVDVITIGKVLQGSALLFRQELAPDPALISGTFSGATVPMAVGQRIIERLTSGGYFGPDGLEARLEGKCREHLDRLSQKYPGVISRIDGVGAMLSFRIRDASLAGTRDFIRRCFDRGLALYYGGHEPACVRLFLPAGVLTEEELADAFDIVEECLPTG